MSSTASNRIRFTPEGGRLIHSIVAGVLAALVGAAVWAVVVEVSGYEVGVVAVGIGFLVGLAMASTAGTSRWLPWIGAGLALAGCLVGDIFVDAYAAGQATGLSTLHVVSLMIQSPSLAGQVFKTGFSGFDVVFWLIACYQGYRLTARAVARAQAGPATSAPATATSAGAARPAQLTPLPQPARHPSDFFTRPNPS